MKNDGGVDKVIAEHANIFFNAGYSYIHIAPVKRLFSKKMAFTLVINGNFVGMYSIAGIKNKIFEFNQKGYLLQSIFVHHLMKHDLNMLNKILSCTEAPILFYIHDYFTICKQYNLLRNGMEFCGAELPSKDKCLGCCFYENQEEKISEIGDFLVNLKDRLTVISPSNIALDIWESTYGGYGFNKKIIPHQVLKNEVIKKRIMEKEIRIAYIGRLIQEKGSDIWKKIIQIRNNEYFYYYYGTTEEEMSLVKKKYVLVDKDNLVAMIEAIKSDDVHVAVLWSTCPETYSYTVFEALVAGCYIITNRNSGNISAVVEKYQCGKVFDSEADAIQYLENVKLVREDIEEYHKKKYFSCVETNYAVLDIVGEVGYTFNSDENNTIDMIIKIEEFLYCIKYRNTFHKDDSCFF